MAIRYNGCHPKCQIEDDNKIRSTPSNLWLKGC